MVTTLVIGSAYVTLTGEVAGNRGSKMGAVGLERTGDE